MRHNQIIKLLSVTVTKDAIGNQVTTTSERTIYANEYYVGGKEFYADDSAYFMTWANNGYEGDLEIAIPDASGGILGA